jgi:hypothetical protein
MPDPVAVGSLAAAGSLALTEGVKFLYAQAGELLKWWRDRRDATAKAQPAATAPAPAPDVQVVPPRVIAGGSFSAKVDSVALGRFEEDLRGLRKDLSEYAEGGTEMIDASDQAAIRHIDALRQILEVVYRRPLTFLGENRTESSPTLNADIDINRVAGYVAGVRAMDISSGTINARIRADESTAGSRVIGVQAGRVGGANATSTEPQKH